MSDLISRQAAIDALVKRTHLTWEYLKIIYPMLNVLEELPSAERRGRWKHISERTHACSICGRKIWIYQEKLPFAKYCPFCGAAMIEEEEA